MVQFFKLRSAKVEDQVATGKSIMAVCNSVFNSAKDSEWDQFNANPRAWISRYYDYCTAAGETIGDGSIPSDITIVPVYDSETHVHVRIPWRGDLKATMAAMEGEDKDEYPGGFPAELARYFLRKCR